MFDTQLLKTSRCSYIQFEDSVPTSHDVRFTSVWPSQFFIQRDVSRTIWITVFIFLACISNGILSVCPSVFPDTSLHLTCESTCFSSFFFFWFVCFLTHPCTWPCLCQVWPLEKQKKIFL